MRNLLETADRAHFAFRLFPAFEVAAAGTAERLRHEHAGIVAGPEAEASLDPLTQE